MLGASTLISAGEREYIEAGARAGVRADGRGREAFRAVELELGVVSAAAGSARVRLGATDVVAAVVAEIETPPADAPAAGRLSATVECSPVASPAFRGRGGDELAAELAAALERSLFVPRGGGAAGAAAAAAPPLDVAALGLVPGRCCWALHVDCVVLGLGGGVLDALSLAVKAALASARLPRVTVAPGAAPGDEPELEVDDDPAAAAPLDASRVPVTVTVARLGGRPAVDLTPAEEACAGGALAVAVDAGGAVRALAQRGGGGGLAPAEVAEAVAVAARVARGLHAALDAAVAERLAAQAAGGGA